MHIKSALFALISTVLPQATVPGVGVNTGSDGEGSATYENLTIFEFPPGVEHPITL